MNFHLGHELAMNESTVFEDQCLGSKSLQVISLHAGAVEITVFSYFSFWPSPQDSG